MGFQGSCPMCGAEVEFNAANSLVVVCESCSSIVGRGDGKLESYGKVADLVQTDSPLQVGARGEVKGTSFEITGRTQYRHSAGGVWDEWYIAFEGGERWGWLAEAQGRYYLTFRKELPENHNVPPLSDLRPDADVMIPAVGALKVAEVGEAELISGEGEIPFAIRPGQRHAYADLHGPGGKFATLDGSENPPILFLGGEFPLERLGLELAESREVIPTAVESQAVSCPQCGGSLELHAPKESERIACPYCDSLLDVEDSGSLKFLHALHNQKVRPLIPLGTEGELNGRTYTVIGFMQRKVVYQGVDYPWTEYLLYTPRQPFHWLINARNHWTLAKPISAGAVRAYTRTAYVKGMMFRTFERSSPIVTAVYGEFYWKVEVGERVLSADYVRAPYLLSREETVADAAVENDSSPIALDADEPSFQPGAGAQSPVSVLKKAPLASREVNYSLGEYVPVEQIEEAFDIKGLPRPVDVAPNQPYPHKPVYKVAAAMLLAVLVAGLLVYVMSPNKQVLRQTFSAPVSGADLVQSKPFELKGMRNVKMILTTPQLGQWAYLDGQLFNEDTKKRTKFTAGIKPMQAGPRRRRVKYLPAPTAGTYTLQTKLRFQPTGFSKDRAVTVEIRQGSPRLAHWLVVLGLLAVLPIGIAIHHMSFEARRWAESDFGMFSEE